MLAGELEAPLEECCADDEEQLAGELDGWKLFEAEVS